MKTNILVSLSICAVLTFFTGFILIAEAATLECPNLSRALYIGTSHAEVSSLQKFLTSTEDFTFGSLTQYFGFITEKAVQKFQCREMGICAGTPTSTGYGRVGPATRTAIQTVCTSGIARADSVSQDQEDSVPEVAIPPQPTIENSEALASVITAIDQALSQKSPGVEE